MSLRSAGGMATEETVLASRGKYNKAIQVLFGSGSRGGRFVWALRRINSAPVIQSQRYF